MLYQLSARKFTGSRLKRGAFTLVELLVVIGIIALLISILLPALQRVREHANQIKCASNMRQIYQSLAMYAGEHQNYLPVPPLIPEVGLAFDWYAYPMVDLAVIDYQNGSLWPYLSRDTGTREAIFNCPSDSEDRRLVSTGNGSNRQVIRRNFSYSFNAQMRRLTDPPNQVTVPIKLTDIVHASQKILIVEEEYPNDGCAYIADVNQDDVLAFRHIHHGNQGFADGHVENLLPTDIGFSDTGGTTSTYSDALAKKQRYCDLSYNF
ncbi:MAG: prepilin-type cleavage/methylation protein [Phycisphaerales bacterium]|jgi:prepilin-type N-terminal cleavage/methylation domain-containing protein/prepilin-type processing-associated H-X9-DG protein|nr:prepilin-type cleavage/methylation protein [Phycisphaerales bacterium]